MAVAAKARMLQEYKQQWHTQTAPDKWAGLRTVGAFMSVRSFMFVARPRAYAGR